MTNNEIINTLKEMMEKYDTNRAAWIAKFGTDQGFDAWFTKQIMGEMK